jgi:hypothetical protein
LNKGIVMNYACGSGHAYGHERRVEIKMMLILFVPVHASEQRAWE